MEATLDGRTIRRIIALLLALAALADRAAGRSLPVRFLVLVFLRRAESVATDFAADLGPWAWPCLDTVPEPGHGPIVAALLGQRLRLLAAVLGAVLEARGEVEDVAPRAAFARDRRPCGGLLSGRLSWRRVVGRVHATGPPPGAAGPPAPCTTMGKTAVARLRAANDDGCPRLARRHWHGPNELIET